MLTAVEEVGIIDLYGSEIICGLADISIHLPISTIGKC